MTKQELINALKNVHGSFVLGNVFLGFSESINWKLIGTTVHEIRSPDVIVRIDLRPIFGMTTSLLKDQPVIVDEFQKMLRRAAVAESFEVLETYCHQSGQIEKIRAVPWYWFAKILRNTVSHKQGELVRWPDALTKKGVSSVTWRHRTLDQTMQTNSLKLQFHDAEILALMADEIDFVENILS
jgi:hypothetical protein